MPISSLTSLIRAADRIIENDVLGENSARSEIAATQPPYRFLVRPPCVRWLQQGSSGLM